MSRAGVTAAVCKVLWLGVVWPLACHIEAAAAQPILGGKGQRLVPLHKTGVQLLSEAVVMEYAATEPTRRRVNLTVTYRYRNSGGKAERVQFGLPEFRCPPSGWVCADRRLRSLKTTIRGRPASYRIQRLSGAASARLLKGRDLLEGEGLAKVYVFNLTFAPHDTVEVLQRYSVVPTSELSRFQFQYATVTGEWPRRIGKAKFTVRYHRDRPNAWDYPDEYHLVSYSERPRAQGRGTGVTQLVFEMGNWTPKVDFRVVAAEAVHGFGFDRLPPRCPSPRATGKELAKKLAKLSDRDLLICKNFPFALHGYPFKTAELRSLFYGPVQAEDKGGVWQPVMLSLEPNFRRLVFHPNPAYHWRLLTPGEASYARTLGAALRRRPKQAVPARATKKNTPKGAASARKAAHKKSSGRRDKSCGCAAPSSPSLPAGFWLLALGLLLLSRRKAKHRASRKTSHSNG